MDEMLSWRTQIAIHRVEDGMVVEPNAIYLIPPTKEMIISRGSLLLTDKDPATGLSLPFDTIFGALAQDVGDRAVGSSFRALVAMVPAEFTSSTTQAVGHRSETA